MQPGGILAVRTLPRPQLVGGPWLPALRPIRGGRFGLVVLQLRERQVCGRGGHGVRLLRCGWLHRRRFRVCAVPRGDASVESIDASVATDAINRARGSCRALVPSVRGTPTRRRRAPPRAATALWASIRPRTIGQPARRAPRCLPRRCRSPSTFSPAALCGASLSYRTYASIRTRPTAAAAAPRRWCPSAPTRGAFVEPRCA